MKELMDIHVGFNKTMVRMDKRSLQFNVGWFIFNAVVIYFDYYNGVHRGNPVSLVCFGMMFGNCFWSLCFLIQSYFELQNSKRNLKYYESRQQDSDVQEAIKLYSQATENYQTACNIIKKNTNSETPVKTENVSVEIAKNNAQRFDSNIRPF